MPIPSARDWQRLRETSRRTEAIPIAQPARQLQTRTAKPRMGRSMDQLDRGVEGDFVILGGQPDLHYVTDKPTVRAFAFCSMAPDTDCILLSMASEPDLDGERTGSWRLAIPCPPETIFSGIPCANCSEEVITAPDLTISGLVDNATYPQFDGWARRLNRTVTMPLVPFPGESFQPPSTPGAGDTPRNCRAQVQITDLPDNTSGMPTGTERGPLTITWIPFPGSAGQPVTLDFVLDSAGFGMTYYENPANQVGRDSEGRVNCTEMYSDWVDAQGLSLPDFKAWLSVATITINSTS